MKIKYGNVVPVDGLILKENSFYVNEAAITGEPDAIRKTPATDQDLQYGERVDPFVLKGSLCESGEATVLVLAVGENTLTEATMPAQVSASDASQTDPSPLQQSLVSIYSKM